MFEPPKSLVDAVAARTLVPFVGAGISVAVARPLSEDQRFPDWKGLIQRLAKRLEDEQGAAAAAPARGQIDVDIMEAAQLAVNALSREAFLKEMKGAFLRGAPVGADLTAVEAIWRLDAPFVMTTNYDSVLEWSSDPRKVQRIHNDDPTEVAAALAASQPDELRRIWHLHGSAGRIDTIILTSSQYERLYPAGSKERIDYQNAFANFRQLLATRSFLFMGFSLAEPVLRKKLQEILVDTARAMPLKYLLLKAGEADAAKKQEFRDNFNVHVIEFEQFGAPMIQAIDAIGRSAWPNRPAPSIVVATPEMKQLATDLRDRLRDLVLPASTIARAFNAAKPDSFPNAPPSGDGIAMLTEAIHLLAGAMSPAGGGLPPLFDFARRIEFEAGEPWESRVKVWLADAIQRLGGDDATRARLTQLAALDPADAPPEPAHVLVRITPSATEPNDWIVHAWLWSGLRAAEPLFAAQGRTFARGNSAEIVQALVAEIEARPTDRDQTSIAFLVPTAIACEALHRWRLDEEGAYDPPIGASYTVTIRPLERLSRSPALRNRYRRAWRDLKQRAAEMLALFDPAQPVPAGIRARFVDATMTSKHDLAMTLDDDKVRCVALREAPSASTLDQLTALVNTTLPAILWYGDANATTAEIEQTVRDVWAAGPAAELPQRIRALRMQAFRDVAAAPRGAHLALIWDDADYGPPDAEASSRAFVEVV